MITTLFTLTTVAFCSSGLANDEMSVNFGPVQQRTDFRNCLFEVPSNDCVLSVITYILSKVLPPQRFDVAQQIRYRSELTAQERDAQARDLRLEDSSNEEHFLKRLIEVIHQRWLNEH